MTEVKPTPDHKPTLGINNTTARSPLSQSLHKLRNQLKDAKGRSELLIVAFADIRSFSAFCREQGRQAPEIAMYIKRVYLKLIDKYFSFATFCKSTGDGMMLIFTFEEDTLADISGKVLRSALQCAEEFPVICDDDPLINFPIPKGVGFGIARGNACCLYSGEEVLDYSGDVLNLAARLMDLARPSGIVLSSNFGMQMIPADLRPKFKVNDNIYVRGLSEAHPISVYYLARSVQIPATALVPPIGMRAATGKANWTLKEFLNENATQYLVELKNPIMLDQLTAFLLHTDCDSNGKYKGTDTSYDLSKTRDYIVIKRTGKIEFRFKLKRFVSILKAKELHSNTKVKLQVDYFSSLRK